MYFVPNIEPPVLKIQHLPPQVLFLLLLHWGLHPLQNYPELGLYHSQLLHSLWHQSSQHLLHTLQLDLFLGNPQ